MRLRTLQAIGSILVALVFVPNFALSQPPPQGANHAGQGVIIELDKQFIDDYANLATITSDHTVKGISAVHKAKNDGEVHIGGWVHKAGLPGVVEVMNAAHDGKATLKAIKDAVENGQPISVTGAWRIWAEHAGTGAQIQDQQATAPQQLPGEYPSNPDHVFEIHPVTAVKVGNHPTDATSSIGNTQGFTPHDANKAFVLGYEKLPCRIIRNGDRIRIITHAVGFNFTEFIIRLGEDPVKLNDGHGVICSVYDTDGELLVRNRRMVFVNGTEADDAVKSRKKGQRLRVIGMPRLSLKLVQWRLKHADDKVEGTDKPKFDVSPLEWHLPYEMIIVYATSVNGDDD